MHTDPILLTPFFLELDNDGVFSKCGVMTYVLSLLMMVFIFEAEAWPGAISIPKHAKQEAFAGRDGVFVLVDAATGETLVSDAKAGAEKLAPCSTFKVWNSVIGLEMGKIKDPDALFWKWDGKKRVLEEWNKDQTLRTAFSSSCVPAFQELARNIGAKDMQKWLDAFQLGDRDISAGIDVFWLPSPPKRKTLLISPVEQAQMLAKLMEGKLPVSKKTLKVLDDISTLTTASGGKFHGKTGTGVDENGAYNMGWFVGWVESEGKTFTFACLLKGKGVMGKDARAATEAILSAIGLLPPSCG